MTEQAKPQAEGRLHVPPFRVSFPQVFTPKAVVAGQEPKYSISMLFPKVVTPEYCKMFRITVGEWTRQMNALKAAVIAAADGMWGPKVLADGTPNPKRPAKLLSPWHDGSEKQYDGYDATVFYASASSKIKPGLVDAKMNPVIETGEFKGGDYAWATVTVYAYGERPPRPIKGVALGLRNIQKLRDGEALGGGAAKPEDDFEPIAAPAQEPATAAAGGSDLGI